MAQQALLTLMTEAYNQVTADRYREFRIQLGQLVTAQLNGTDETKIMVALRRALLQADLTLTLKQRITGLPLAYQKLYNDIAPRLKQTDARVIDRYTHYGFIPMRLGSTVKYS